MLYTRPFLHSLRLRPSLQQLSAAPTPTPAGRPQCSRSQGFSKCHDSSIEGIKEAQDSAVSRPPRFYVEAQLPRHTGEAIDLDPDESKHATKALRLTEGDRVELCDGRGSLVLAQVSGASKKAVTVEAVAEARQDAWHGPKWEVVAGFGMLKGGRADWLVEKAAELGAHTVVPLVSERVHGAGAGWKVDARPPKHKEESPHGRQARWERVAIAANKQSLRTHGLLVRPQTLLAELLPEVSAAPLALVAVAGAPELLHRGGPAHDLAALGDGDRALLCVGPEGDFTPSEVDSLIQAGARPVGLGPLRLRVETAAVALLAAACAYHRAAKPQP